MAAAEGESCAVRFCGSSTVDVVRIALFALRLQVGEYALEVGWVGLGWGWFGWVGLGWVRFGLVGLRAGAVG